MITADRLREVLDYDPATGDFTRIADPSPRSQLGAIVGSRTPLGYWRICIDSRDYQAHRLAWLFMTGEWPGEIDHRDGDPANNAWSNLREATRSGNNANRAARPARNLPKGVRRAKTGRYEARITFAGETKHLGTFDTPDQANAAFYLAARSLHGDFARAQ